ncbi:MarR family winged helix-turn-helix transcriptional regulator [Saccharopolyspora griseoalba]|uniref:MarR family winged helix-turn-helix transcriptional regulator n=1 Tax=Saccharopolyspora griseoalba TaxID=1431848 RepID=A0ABW2LTN5_9PSEU
MPGPLDDRLVTTFGRLIEAYSRLEQRLGPAMEADTGLPLTWFEVLIRLARSPERQLTMGALAEEIALTTGGVTRLVDRMEKAGYVERLPCPGDRRVSYAAITSTGREILDRAAAQHARELGAAFADFTEQDLDALDGLLDRLRARG